MAQLRRAADNKCLGAFATIFQAGREVLVTQGRVSACMGITGRMGITGAPCTHREVRHGNHWVYGNHWAYGVHGRDRTHTHTPRCKYIQKVVFFWQLASLGEGTWPSVKWCICCAWKTHKHKSVEMAQKRGKPPKTNKKHSEHETTVSAMKMTKILEKNPSNLVARTSFFS